MTTTTGRRRTAERAAFLADTITTAVEGGIGYWATVTGYRWFSPELAGGTAEPGPGGTATAWVALVDREGDGAPYVVTLEDMARAYGVVRDRVPDGWNERAVSRMRDAYRECDAGDVDADDADCLLQVAVFGTVIYG